MPLRELNAAQWAKLLRMARYLQRFRKLRHLEINLRLRDT